LYGSEVDVHVLIADREVDPRVGGEGDPPRDQRDHGDQDEQDLLVTAHTLARAPLDLQ
jgi:hypothetical protein